MSSNIEREELIIEQLRYKTPEELAVALEEQSKITLAKRVREIWLEIKDNSIDWREKLRKELNQKEQQEIRSVLPWTWLDIELDRWIAIDEDNWKMVNQIPQIWEKLEKKWFIDIISDIWDNFGNAIEIYEKISKNYEWFWWFIKWITAAIAYFFSGKIPDWLDLSFRKLQKEEEKPENKSERIENENLDTTFLSMKMFINYNYKWKNKEILNIAQTENFKELSIKDIKDIKNDDKKIENWKNDTYPNNNNIKIEDIKELFSLFSKDKTINTIKWIYWNNYNEDIKLKDLLSLSKENKDMVIYEKFSNADIFSISDTPSEFINFDKDTLSKWTLWQEFIDRWINLKIANVIINNNYSTWDNIDSFIENKWLEEKEKNKIKEIIDFWDKILKLIESNNILNFWNKYTNLKLDIKDITKIYVVLWWETDFEKMNEFKQSYLFFLVPWILWKNDRKFEEWRYLSNLWIKIWHSLTDKTTDIPEWVRNFLSNMWEKIIESSLDYLKSFWLKITWWASQIIKEYPWLVPTIITRVLLYPFVQRKTILWTVLEEKWYKKSR